MGLNLSKFYAFFAFFILFFLQAARTKARARFLTATSREIIFTWRLALAGGS